MSDRVVDFTQVRVNLIADALDRMTDQMLATNQRLLALYEEFGEFKSEMRSELRSIRSEANSRFDALDQRIRSAHGEVILLANQILNAQRDANRALFQLADIQEQQAGEAGESRPPNE